VYWNSPNTGATNSSGFTGLPGGYSFINGTFGGLADANDYWSSSEVGSNAWYRYIEYNHAQAGRDDGNKAYGFSVRCIYDSIIIPNLPPEIPSNPQPENGAFDINVDTVLSWTCSDPENDLLIYDVYFGTNNPPPLISSGQIENYFDPGVLNYETLYYWSIDAHDDQSNTTDSPIWNFITVINQPPASPANPNPVNGAHNQDVNLTLSWICSDPENDLLTYAVYFGTDNPPPLVSIGQNENYFNPGTLNYETTYYWSIIAHDNYSNITEGPIWSLTTVTEGMWFCGDTIHDNRDGQIYSTVQIGYQCWMAENLSIGTFIPSYPGGPIQTNNGIIEKYCYNNFESYCEEYGGLYQWDEAMEYSSMPGNKGICPNGWHLPTDAEWSLLSDFLGGWIIAGGRMKEPDTTHWSSPNIGATNSSGFTALGAGVRQFDDTFCCFGWNADFWSSTEHSNNWYAWHRELNNSHGELRRFYYTKSNGFSVRCVKDFSNIPSNPDPPDASMNQSVNILLGWEIINPANEPLTYDVYFGPTNPPALVSEGQSGNSYDPPGDLVPGTTYYWQIIVYDNNNNQTPSPLWSFSTGFNPCPGIETVEYEGQTYYTVQIGSQCWLQQNLNVGVRIDGSEEQSDNDIIEKYCYNDSESNCSTYGGLYQWNEMMKYNSGNSQGICPEGWKVPSDADWCTLEQYVDPTTTDCFATGYRGTNGGLKLKAAGNNWNPPGTNEYGFTALASGVRTTTGYFQDFGVYSIFWSRTLSEDYHYWTRWLYQFEDRIYRAGEWWPSGYSVRCIKD